ncbi:MAG: EscU/YscU/HrcU family type III secretion system export apparatus switch protein [Zavarzinia sp.]|nr:EscU/YscU/HrcU family type III secretion system export apparatus switch protein [Zavarzinia sp.]
MTDATRKSPAKAVALNYRRGADPAPRVVARGRGEVAERIVAMALAHDIKLREDGDLVEILERVDLDETIPLEAFAAVAEILAHVYMANNRLREAREIRDEPPGDHP